MEKEYKKLENLFIAFMAIQTTYTLVALYMSSNDIALLLPVNRDAIKIFVMIQIFITVVFGNYFSGKKFKLAEKENNTEKKHRLYYTAYSTRLLLLTLCNILNVTAFITTLNEIYAIVTIPLLFLYFIYKPDRKLFEDLPETTDS